MPKGRLPFKSLDAATVTGAGAVLDLEGVAEHFTFFTWDSGSGTGLATVHYEVSPDGNVWFVWGSPHDVASPPGGNATYTTSHEGLFRYLRANLTSTSAGHIVSAWIMIGDTS